MEDSSSMPIEKVVAIPTFIGSLLSFLATSTAIVLHLIFPPSRHFRHALIINLLIADFINSLNNTISGGIYLGWGRTGNPDMPPSSSCIANAWIGQLTVQTVDFTILIISISVLSIVLSKSPMNQPSLKATIATCAAAWVPGIITSNVALGYDVYGHVSGNWCWILPDPRFRYGLTHGWRIAIFIATIGIYTAIYIHLKRVFNKIRISSAASDFTRDRDNDKHHSSHPPTHAGKKSSKKGKGEDARKWRISAPIPQENFHTGGYSSGPPVAIPLRTATTASDDTLKASMDDGASTHPFAAAGSSSDDSLPAVQHASTVGTEGGPDVRNKVPAPPNLKRMLLMNGYPIAYIILWIPGMANRLVEVVNGSSPVWLRALQASTQFVGLANAITYGLNEQTRGRWTSAWKNKVGKV